MPDPLLLLSFFAPTLAVFVLFIDRDSTLEPRTTFVVAGVVDAMVRPSQVNRKRRKSSGQLLLSGPFRACHGFGQNVLLVEDGDGFRGLADSEIQSMHRFFIFAGLTII